MRGEGCAFRDSNPDSLPFSAEAARRQLQSFRFAAVADQRVRAGRAANRGRRQAIVLPGDVHLEPAARAEPLDASRRPALGQCGQQMDLARVALQQHFRYPGGVAEVAVDLERRMGVEQVRQDAILEQLHDQLVRPVAIVQARPEVDLPGGAPPGADVAAGVERDACRVGQRRRGVRRYLPAGMHGEQVRNVPVGVFGIVDVRSPFLQLAPAADLRAEQFGAHGGDFRPVGRVDAQDLAGGEIVRKQVPDELLIHRHAVRRWTVLGRETLRHHERAVGQCLKTIFPELAQFLQDGIGHRAQILLVLGERIVLPEMLAVPGVGRETPRPASRAEDVVLAADGPTALALMDLLAGVVAARLNHAAKVGQKRLVAFGQPGRLGQPVVHLHVDVGVVIAAPGRVVPNVPHPLKIGRQRSRPRRTDQQIAAILKQQRLQFGVVRLLLVLRQSLVGRQRPRLCRRASQVQGHAIEQPLVIGDVVRFQPLVGRLRRDGEDLFQPGMGRFSEPTLVVVVHVRGAGGKKNRQRIDAGETDGAAVHRERAALVQHQHLRFIIQTVAKRTGGGEFVVRGNGLGVVRVDQADDATVPAGLVRREPQYHHLGRVAAKIFALKRRAAAAVRHAMQRLPDVQLAAIVRGADVAQLDVQIAQRLIRAGVFVAVAAGPQAVLIELDSLGMDAAENHAADVAVADRQGIRLPHLRRLAIP